MVVFILTDWHKNNPNDWCALEPKTNKLLDRDDSLMHLVERMGRENVVYCSNWFRPQEL